MEAFLTGPYSEAVPYFRQSKPTRSGRAKYSQEEEAILMSLGLDAQREAIKRFIQDRGYTRGPEYIEVVSGRKKGKQLELKAAIEYCLKKRATLLIADMERLGRRLGFTANLIESRVRFICVDCPDANEMELQFRALLAHAEGARISKRTKDALQQAKANGQVLGQYGREVLSKENAAAAARFAEVMRPIFAQLDAAGFNTIRAKVDELNRRNVPTYRGPGNRWHFCSVQSLAKRMKAQL